MKRLLEDAEAVSVLDRFKQKKAGSPMSSRPWFSVSSGQNL